MCYICDETSCILSESFTDFSLKGHAFVKVQVDTETEPPTLDVQYGIQGVCQEWTSSIPLHYCFNCGRRLT